jgi:hypothetical protein
VAANMTPERLALVKQCIDDGWSQIEIYRTHKVHPMTQRRHFPGKGWTAKQGAAMGHQIMKAGQKK